MNNLNKNQYIGSIVGLAAGDALGTTNEFKARENIIPIESIIGGGPFKLTFPEDLKFQVTANKKNFQGRYILTHKWFGKSTCKQAKEYQANLPDKVADEADNLTKLTGWDLKTFKNKLEVNPRRNIKGKSGNRWWDNLWNQ